jgi:hypothetical protein
MALLVKHRGGGPFGAGRLSQADVPNLEAALVDVLAVIKQAPFSRTLSLSLVATSLEASQRPPFIFFCFDTSQMDGL